MGKGRWQDKLTKEELAHVREWGGGNLTAFKQTRKIQREMKDRADTEIEPCWACRQIAVKLGLE